VGDALIVGCAMALMGAGVEVGAELHAVKATPNPIATPNPMILNIFKYLLCFILSLLNLSVHVEFLQPQSPLRSRYFQYTSALGLPFQFWLNSHAFLSFLSGCAWQSFMARRYPIG
jgi:hypothetical protein